MPSHLKKVWDTLTTGWVIEYPGKCEDGPSDFFEAKSPPRKPKWVTVVDSPSGSEVGSRRQSLDSNREKRQEWHHEA